uniref:EF-hand domain-containing protein n=1 Tax=Triticum urartu TaxID=4572 RepID=A0A8R7RDT1_TRIUA
MALFLNALWGGGKPLALVLTTVLLCVLRPGGQLPKGKEESSSMADVYNHELTPLQKHVAFFDRNKDGVIHPSETYEGFRAIGCGVALSAFSAVFINGLLGPKTIPVYMH